MNNDARLTRLAPTINIISEVILSLDDPVDQQCVIEALMVLHASRLVGKESYVIDSMRKHAKQFGGW